MQFREGLKKVINATGDLKVIGECCDGRELLNSLNQSAPDMVILDLSMPNVGGIEAAHEIRMKHPDVRVLMLTIHKEREYLFKAVSAGVKGFLTKDNADTELFPAIETIRQGGTYFPNFVSGGVQDIYG